VKWWKIKKMWEFTKELIVILMLADILNGDLSCVKKGVNYGQVKVCGCFSNLYVD